MPTASAAIFPMPKSPRAWNRRSRKSPNSATSEPSGFGFAAAFLHDLALGGALASHFLGIGDQRAVDFHPVEMAQHGIGLGQLAENADLVRGKVDLGEFV